MLFQSAKIDKLLKIILINIYNFFVEKTAFQELFPRQ